MHEMVSSGIYPMLYAFFDESGHLRNDAFQRQADVILNTEAAGAAILGLGTEVSKLSGTERTEAVRITAQSLAGKKPLLVTVFGETAKAQIDFAQRAIDLGASALLLQPPPEKLSDSKLKHFFSKVIEAVECPIGVQNAPEFLGYGLSPKSLTTLADTYDHFSVIKLECTAVALQQMSDAIGETTQIFNGRCGLELTDNLRAGASGIIPGFETVDKTSEIYRTFVNGNESRAEELYKDLLPILCFIMQGIPHFITYGKLLAAIRLNINAGGSRDPALAATEFGTECIKRFAKSLGRLPD